MIGASGATRFEIGGGGTLKFTPGTGKAPESAGVMEELVAGNLAGEITDRGDTTAVGR